MEEIFKKALDRSDAPVSSRVWTTIHAHLPKPWYLQAWVGWAVAFLSWGGMLGMGYQMWRLDQKWDQHLQHQVITHRIDTVVISRVDTIYLQVASSYSLSNTITRPTALETVKSTEREASSSRLSPNLPTTSEPRNMGFLSDKEPVSTISDNKGQYPEREALPTNPEAVRSSSEVVPPQTEVEAAESKVAATESKAENPAQKESAPEASMKPPQQPWTTDWRVLVTPAVSPLGAWSMRVGAEWEIRSRWGVGLGLQGDFFPEVEYDRVADFVSKFGKTPSQIYPELSDVPISSQNNLEDIEIQRSIFSIPLYTRYYVPMSRGWRWYPEIGYRFRLKTRERVDVDFETEAGPDFRLFTAQNSIEPFSRLYLGTGFDWQRRGWTVQTGARWAFREGLFFQVSLGRSLMKIKQPSAFRF